MVTLILLLAAAGLAYCLLCLISPTRRCPACAGMRVLFHGRGKRKPPRRCPRCKAHGRVTRRGAGAVHRFVWSVLGGQLRHDRKDS
jgi:hypothetical protein